MNLGHCHFIKQFFRLIREREKTERYIFYSRNYRDKAEIAYLYLRTSMVFLSHYTEETRRVNRTHKVLTALVINSLINQRDNKRDAN